MLNKQNELEFLQECSDFWNKRTHHSMENLERAKSIIEKIEKRIKILEVSNVKKIENK